MLSLSVSFQLQWMIPTDHFPRRAIRTPGPNEAPTRRHTLPMRLPPNRSLRAATGRLQRSTRLNAQTRRNVPSPSDKSCSLSA